MVQAGDEIVLRRTLPVIYPALFDLGRWCSPIPPSGFIHRLCSPTKRLGTDEFKPIKFEHIPVMLRLAFHPILRELIK